MAKEKTKYEIVPVYYLSEEQMKELDLEEWEEMALFEWDPDYMIETRIGHGWKEYERPVYFFIWKDENIIVVSEEDFEHQDELLEFCEGQDPTVSRAWYNTRSETKHREYLEDNTRDGREKCKNLKIAYRGWCGYVYTLFEYLPDNEENDG